MKVINRMKKFLFLSSVVLGMLGCSHGPEVQDFPDTASPKEEVTILETDMNVAIENQINILSPYNFKEAQDALKDAKKSLDKQKSAKDTLHLAAVGRTYLNRSNEFAQISHTNIEEVIIARQQAILAGAPT